MKDKRIIIGSDHGGYELKSYIIEQLKDEYEINDVGTHSLDSCDYPIFAREVAEGVASGSYERGIVICTSGEGVAIMANKVKGIRCGIGYNEEVAHLIVEHNDANMLSMGAKYLSHEEALKIVREFLNATHLGGRHEKRVNLIKEFENNQY